MRALRLRAAALVTAVALVFDLLFFAVDELPATVPVALGMVVLLVLRGAARSGARVTARGGGGYGPGDARAHLPAQAQVYVDERPRRGTSRRYYDWARTHDSDWVYDARASGCSLPFCMLAFRARCRRRPSTCRAAAPAIIAPNHFSAMDHFFCGIYLRRRVRFMAKSQLFSGVLAWILRHGGAFPVQRGRARRAGDRDGACESSTQGESS